MADPNRTRSRHSGRRTAALACLAALPGASLPAAAEFRDCAQCPVMISVPAGTFQMGTPAGEGLVDPRTGEPATNDAPRHEVTIGTPFALGKYEVTVGEYAAFVAATGHVSEGRCMGFTAPDRFTFSDDFDWQHIDTDQADDYPVTCVSWFDAGAYADWLARATGQPYRLPSEAEWEYAARAGSTTPYYWGTDAAAACRYANVRSPGARSISKRQSASDRDDGFPCDDGFPAASPAGSFRPNGFGLYDMQGNAWEWVADCNHPDYTGAPADGRPWLEAGGRDCQFGLLRSGSFLNRVERSSTTVRVGRPRNGQATNIGFRVARGAAVGAAPAPASGGAPASAGAGPADGSPGAVLFGEHCQACHQRSDSLRGLYGRSQQAVAGVIRSGGNNVMSMPAFGDTLTAEEIDTLAAWLRQVNGWD